MDRSMVQYNFGSIRAPVSLVISSFRVYLAMIYSPEAICVHWRIYIHLLLYLTPTDLFPHLVLK
jgi:hypothetical protein